MRPSLQHSRSRAVAFALLAATLFAGPLPAQHGGGRGGNRPPTDVVAARQKLLEKSPPDDKDFGALVTAANDEATKRKLPSFNESPENTYLPELVAFRAEIYGPVRDLPATRELMRALVRKPATAFDFTATTAALVLADAPDADDLAALYAGYLASTPENRSSIARQLGRALTATRAAPPPVPARDEVVARLRADAAEGKAAGRGAALEALWRAGETATALQLLKELMEKSTDPVELITVLQACSRLIQHPDVDPFLRSRAVAAAHSAVEEILADRSEISPTQTISGKGRLLRSAISFLQDVAGAREFDLAVRCLDDARAQKLLGMDGLQNLRFGFQRLRGQVPAEAGTKVDDWYLKLLVDAGTRLFALDEEPMTAAEQRAFWDSRDLRYNALSYFVDQVRRTPAVKARLGAEGDLAEHLATIVRAREDKKETRDGDTVYVAVADKLENRIMALQLLANLEREFNKGTANVDVFGEAFAILCAEVQAPLVDPAQVVTFRRAYAPHVRLNFPIGKEPADDFVKRAAAMTIATLGYVVWTPPGSIGLEVDAENPWPWPRDGQPALAPEKPAADTQGEEAKKGGS